MQCAKFTTLQEGGGGGPTLTCRPYFSLGQLLNWRLGCCSSQPRSAVASLSSTVVSVVSSVTEGLQQVNRALHRIANSNQVAANRGIAPSAARGAAVRPRRRSVGEGFAALKRSQNTKIRMSQHKRRRRRRKASPRSMSRYTVAMQSRSRPKSGSTAPCNPMSGGGHTPGMPWSRVMAMGMVGDIDR